MFYIIKLYLVTGDSNKVFYFFIVMNYIYNCTTCTLFYFNFTTFSSILLHFTFNKNI